MLRAHDLKLSTSVGFLGSMPAFMSARQSRALSLAFDRPSCGCLPRAYPVDMLRQPSTLRDTASPAKATLLGVAQSLRIKWNKELAERAESADRYIY